MVRKNEEPSLGSLLHQAVFVMQAGEHRRLLDAMTGWQRVPVVGERNFVLGGLRKNQDPMRSEAGLGCNGVPTR